MSSPIPTSDTGSGAELGAARIVDLSFANIPQVLVAHLSPTPGLGGVGIDMPNPPPLPFILITETICPDDYVWSWSYVDLDLYAADPGSGKDIGRVVHARMMALQFSTTMVGSTPVEVANVRTDSAFAYRYYEDPNVHRTLAKYRIKSYFHSQPL